MRTAGIREVRQRLSALMREIAVGREVEITDRGVAVARIVPRGRMSARPFRSHAALRASIKVKGALLSVDVAAGREDRV